MYSLGFKKQLQRQYSRITSILVATAFICSLFGTFLTLSPQASATFPGQNGVAYIAQGGFPEEFVASDESVVTLYPVRLFALDIRDTPVQTEVLPVTQNGDIVTHISPYPSSSPDGNRLAFVEEIHNLLMPNDPPVYKLWVMDSGGSNKRQVLLPVVLTDFFGLSWSPDNQTIVMQGSSLDYEDTDLYTLNVDSPSATPQPLLTGEETMPNNPRWSPDGDKIAYDDAGTLYILDVSDGLHNRTTPGSPITKAEPNTNVSNPSWEPSGTLLGVESSNATQELRAYRYQSDNSAAPEEIVAANILSTPIASPDGTSLLYAHILSDFTSIEIIKTSTNGNNPEVIKSYPLSQGATAPIDWQVLPVQVESIGVQPSPAVVNRGAQQQLTVTANYSDESTQDVTSQATYSSSNSGVVSVDANGNITGVSVGQATVTASFEGKTADTLVTVNPVAPQPPSNLTVVNGSSTGRLNLSWSAPTDDGGSAITNYLVFRRTGTTGSFTQVASTNGSLSYSDSGLTTGTTYYYYVVAVNSAGQSSPSTTVSRQAPGIFGDPVCILFICI